MFRAIWNCFWRAATDASTWFGVVSFVVATISQATGKAVGPPTWIWWAGAVIFMFITACRAYFELDKEREDRRLPEPTMSLADVLSRIADRGVLFGSNSLREANSQTIFDLLGELAANGHIIAFGKECSHAPVSPLLYGAYPRTRIPSEIWKNNKLDYTEYALHKATLLTPVTGYTPTYMDIWFDEKEINRRWPAPKKWWKTSNS